MGIAQLAPPFSTNPPASNLAFFYFPHPKNDKALPRTNELKGSSCDLKPVGGDVVSKKPSSAYLGRSRGLSYFFPDNHRAIDPATLHKGGDTESPVIVMVRGYQEDIQSHCQNLSTEIYIHLH